MAKRKMPDSSIDEFPGNQKEERKEITKVVKGTVIRRKKPLLARWFGDSMDDIGAYVIWDVLIPAAKSTISDIITNSIEMLLYGSTERGKYIRRDRSRSYVNYNSLYDHKRRRDRTTTTKSPSRHDFNEVIFERRIDAEEVLSNLVELIDMYDVATVADFYSAAGLDEEWNDHKFGWDNLARGTVKRIREGYILVLPRPIQLE